MYKLYHSPLSQHARRVVSVLETGGIEYELVPVAIEKGAHMAPDFVAVNPNHQLPAMEVDGEILLESNAIMRFLCDEHGLDSWYPKGAKARAKVDQWLDWNQCRLMEPTTSLVINKALLGDNGDKDAIARAESKLVDVLGVLEEHLDGRDWVAADSPTIADLSIGSNVFQLGFAQVTPTTPHTAAWFSRVMELPGFKASLPPPQRAE